MLGTKSGKVTFFMSAVAGILGVVIWDYLLKTPGGFSGLIFGVITNMVVFIVFHNLEKR